MKQLYGHTQNPPGCTWMIKWSAIDISWCMISNQPVGSSLDTQPTAAVRRASILTHTNMGVFQSNYTDFVGIFMKEQWERLREHMPKIMIHGLFKDCFYFPPLLGLISTRVDWKHQPVEGLFINWWKCVTWRGRVPNPIRLWLSWLGSCFDD